MIAAIIDYIDLLKEEELCTKIQENIQTLLKLKFMKFFFTN